MKISFDKAAQLLGVSKDTLRRWEKDGKIKAYRTMKGHRRYDEGELTGLKKRNIPDSKITLGYARVSSHDQKKDLVRQVELLESYSVANGWSYEIMQDLGSSLNYQKKRFKTINQKNMLKVYSKVSFNS